MFFKLYLNKFDCVREIQDNKRRCSWNCSQIVLPRSRFSVIRVRARVLWVIQEIIYLSINKKMQTRCFMDIERIHDVLYLCHLSFWFTNYHFGFHMLTFIRVLQYPSFHLWNVFVPPWFHSSEPSHHHIGFFQLLSSTLHDLKMFQ